MIVKFKKLHPDAVIPRYAKPGDAGLDLTAVTAGGGDEGYIEYGTGLAVEIPQGYVGLLFPRSSISNQDVFLTNSVGVIDSGYRGEIKARFKVTADVVNVPDDEVRAYRFGDRILQLVVIPYPTIEPTEADDLSATERGAGGYGSSGA
jgi:dUTP pyrophosphatase